MNVYNKRLLNAAAFAVMISSSIVAHSVVANDDVKPEEVTLAKRMDEIADKVKVVMSSDRINRKRIFVGRFVGKGGNTIGSTPTAINVLLAKALKARDIEVVNARQAKQDDYKLSGIYRIMSQPNNDLFALHVEATVEDEQGGEISTIGPVPVYDIDDITRVLGASGAIPTKNDELSNVVQDEVIKRDESSQRDPAIKVPPKKISITTPPVASTDNDRERHKTLEATTKKPTVVSERVQPLPFKTRIRPRDGSPYAVEILVKQHGDPQPPKARAVVVENGRPFVEIKHGEVYQVRVYNDSDYDVGVNLRIDGVNCFEFSKEPALKKLGLWVIQQRGEGTIKGWYEVSRRQPSGSAKIDYYEFAIGDYVKSPAAELGLEEDIGVITVAFRAAWEPDQTPPPEYMPTGRRATVAGEKRQTDATFLTRQFGKTREFVTIRYEKPKGHPGNLPQ